MSEYPKLSDAEGWRQRLLKKYRAYPLLLQVVLLVFCLPFVFLRWMGEHGEILMEVTGEAPSNPKEPK